MSIKLALEGAKVELAQTPGCLQKLKLCSSYTKIIAQELLGTVSLIPYGIKAFYLYHTLPPVHKSSNSSVTLKRKQRYGPADRCVLDIYFPPGHHGGDLETVGKAAAKDVNDSGGKTGAAIAVFCHGGIWAIGERWQFSPLAHRLAQEGIIAVVLGYTLHPQAKVQQMVNEVSDAISYVLRKANALGGSPDRVTVVGHSAGAQLCLMALIQRAWQLHSDTNLTHEENAYNKPFMPAAFLGMAGVYDIAKHYEYEEGRGVAFLSTMERAIGGKQAFNHQSPACLLSLPAKQKSNVGEIESETAREDRLRDDSAMKQRGRAVKNAEGKTGIVATSLTRSQPTQEPLTLEKGGSATISGDVNQDLALPPIHLMSSKKDITVPWSQSQLMHQVLTRRGNSTQHTCYADYSHADFAIGWRAKSKQPLQNSPGYLRDAVNIIKTAGTKHPDC